MEEYVIYWKGSFWMPNGTNITIYKSKEIAMRVAATMHRALVIPNEGLLAVDKGCKVVGFDSSRLVNSDTTNWVKDQFDIWGYHINKDGVSYTLVTRAAPEQGMKPVMESQEPESKNTRVRPSLWEMFKVYIFRGNYE